MTDDERAGSSPATTTADQLAEGQVEGQRQACGAVNPADERSRCWRPTGHHGRHADYAGDQWVAADSAGPPLCGAQVGLAGVAPLRCRQPKGHDGQHQRDGWAWADGDHLPTLMGSSESPRGGAPGPAGDDAPEAATSWSDHPDRMIRAEAGWRAAAAVVIDSGGHLATVPSDALAHHLLDTYDPGEPVPLGAVIAYYAGIIRPRPTTPPGG